MTNRLFVTLDIPGNTIQKISSIVRNLYGKGKARWEDESKLHITLKFLGDTDANLIDDIINRLEKVSAENKNFEAEFDRFGIFYRNNSPKIFWIGISENPRIIKLQEDVETELSSLGFKREKRKFHPHLTLLRTKGDENLKVLNEIKNSNIEPIQFSANQISLMKSELKPTGSIYKTIQSFKLS